MRMPETELSGRTTKSGEKSSTTPARRLKLTRPEPTEADIQSAIMRALRVHPAVVWHERMNSAAGHLLYPDGKKSRFIRFGFLGQPDILGQVRGGKLLAIEVKRPSGKTSSEQKAFLLKAEANGAIAFVARSVADVFEVLDGVMRDQNSANGNAAKGCNPVLAAS